ncbi:MAG: ABC transporter substrate-binding protein [Bacteroidales bacterium]|nr:ABC transporter substrate-binding protein [Bacteroidales bacterium]
MKRLTALLAAALCACSLYAQKVTFAPQWTPQAQFAGFYVACEKGFFAEEGLDVEIKHPGINSSVSSMDMLKSGSVQIAGFQLIQGIIARADGARILNVFQTTQESGLCCVSRKPISSPVEMDGLKIGRWKVGFSDFCEMLETYNNIHIDWVPFLNGIGMYVYGAVDATLCYSYSELIALELAIGKIPEDQILFFSDFGYECPEDGLYVMEDYYNSHKDVIDKFIKASKRGWVYARTHRDETLDITWKYIKAANINTNRETQRRMLDAYIALQQNKISGRIDFAPVKPKVFKSIVKALEDVGYITEEVEYNDIIR